MSLRIGPALVSPHHLAIGREQPVKGGFDTNPTIESRGQQLGPWSAIPPVVTGLPDARSWPSPSVRLDLLLAPEAGSIPQKLAPPSKHAAFPPGPSISQPASSGWSQQAARPCLIRSSICMCKFPLGIS